MKKIIAMNTDGFGARFAAIINAIRISRSMNLDFCFTWSSRGGNNDLFHTVEDKEEIFNQSFIEKYCLDNINGNQVGKFRDYFTNKEKFDYFRSHSTMPFFNSALTEFNFDFNKELFYKSDILDFIGFTPKYRQIIEDVEKARKKIEGYAVAVHMRGGDVILKEKYNSRVGLVIKILPINVAIFLYIQKNAKYLFFIQDECVQSFLKEKYDISSSSDFYPKNKIYDRYEQAFFDMILMSKCDKIIAPYSGFSISASYLSGKDIISYRNILTNNQIVDIIRNGFNKECLCNNMPSEYVSYEILTLLFYGKNILSREEYLYWCDEGYRNNSKNSIFVLLKIFCLLYYGMFEEAKDVVIRECFLDEHKFKQILMAIETNACSKVYFERNTFFLEVKQKSIFKNSDELETLFFLIFLKYENGTLTSFVEQYGGFLFLEKVSRAKISKKIKEYIDRQYCENFKRILEKYAVVNDNEKLVFYLEYGTAKARIQNQLSYKIGQALIANSK
ncbi:hypothetical protein B6S12_10520, partial [Helicobacter valdiviensis]